MNMSTEEALRNLEAPGFVRERLAEAKRLPQVSSDPQTRLERASALTAVAKWLLEASKKLTTEITQIGNFSRYTSNATVQEARLLREVDDILRSRLSGGVTQQEALDIKAKAFAAGFESAIRRISDQDGALLSYQRRKAALASLEREVQWLQGKNPADEEGNVRVDERGNVKVDRQGNIVA